jgi:transcriptional regulator with XRE-family HTH domain
MSEKSRLARLLSDLRARSGLSLRDVEKRTEGVVSNVYLSQLEHGHRADPNPRVLVALARVYKAPVGALFEAANYVDAPPPSALEVAYQQVLADAEFQFGTRLRGEPDEASKRVIVELYERVTGKKLLPDGSE